MIAFFKRYVFHNFGLKIVSLLLATWLVVHDFARRTACRSLGARAHRF